MHRPVSVSPLTYNNMIDLNPTTVYTRVKKQNKNDESVDPQMFYTKIQRPDPKRVPEPRKSQLGDGN